MAATKEDRKKKRRSSVAEKKVQTEKGMQETICITELDQYLFGQGTHYDIYKKLGAHPTTRNGKSGVYFAVWRQMQQKYICVETLTDGMKIPIQ